MGRTLTLAEKIKKWADTSLVTALIGFSVWGYNDARGQIDSLKKDTTAALEKKTNRETQTLQNQIIIEMLKEIKEDLKETKKQVDAVKTDTKTIKKSTK